MFNLSICFPLGKILEQAMGENIKVWV